MTFPQGGGIGFQNTGEVIANVVIIKGTTGGLFLYNGTPSLGNPPILAAVPPGVTKDPFGNTVKTLLNLGNLAGAHAGFDQYGDFFLADSAGVTRMIMTTSGAPFNAPGMAVNDPAIIFYNAFGAIIMVVDPVAGGQFQYLDNSSAVQGSLIGANVGKITSDPVLGNVVSAGVNIINPVFGDLTRVVGSNIFINNLNFNNNAVIAPAGGTPAGAVGPAVNIQGPFQTGDNCLLVSMFGESPDTTVAPGMVLASAASHAVTVVKATSGLLELQGAPLDLGNLSGPAGASVAGFTQLYSDQFSQLHTDRAFASDSYLESKNIALPGTSGAGFKLWSSGGSAQVQEGQVSTGGDTNNYDIEHLTLLTPNPSGAGQIINNTLVTILSKHVGIGTYHIRGKVIYIGNQAGGVPTIAASGPAVSGNVNQLFTFTVLNNGATQPIPLFTRGALGGSAGPALVLNQFVAVDIDIKFTTTAAGTFSITGISSILNDTFTIQALSDITIEPVVAT